MTLILLPKAVADIEQAFGYIHAENPKAAQNLKLVLNKTFARLSNRPHLGRLSIDSDYREWSVTNWPYMIIYRVEGHDVEILRVWHTRQDRFPDA